MVNAQYILDLARNYRNLGKQERAELEMKCREYPWFQLLHVLLAKSNQNEKSSLYDGTLKRAAAYVGDRSVMYDIMHNMLLTPDDKVSVFVDEANQIANSDNLLDSAIEEQIEEFPETTAAEDVISEVIPDAHELSEDDGLIDIPVKEEELLTVEEPVNEEIPEFTDQTLEPELLINDDSIVRKKEDILENELAENSAVIENNSGELDTSENDVNESTTSKEFTIVYDPLIELAGLEVSSRPEKESLPVISVYDPEKELSGYIEENQESEHDFSYWLDHFKEPESEKQPVSEDTTDLLSKFLQEKPSITRPKVEFYKPENMARKSEELNLDFVSSSLAELFVRQGHTGKAIEIYKKLILQNPANSAFFAARIQELELK